MRKLVAVLCAVVCIVTVAIAMLTRMWWSAEDRRWTTVYGLQSYKVCADGGDCLTRRYVAETGGGYELVQEADEQQLWLDDASRDSSRAALAAYDSFATRGMFAGLAAIVMMLALLAGAVATLLRKPGGARAAGWFALATGVAAVALTLLFFQAQPVDEARRARGKDPLSVGAGLPLMLGGLGAGLMAGGLFATTKAAWQEELDDLPPTG